nr:MAG TPA: hypothetical protein [Caudoviricetes sp.]
MTINHKYSIPPPLHHIIENRCENSGFFIAITRIGEIGERMKCGYEYSIK